TWNSPETLALLHEHGAGICNIDQPLIGRSLAPSAQATSPVGYVRLHGRRYDTWFTDDETVPSHERYNYLYSADELEPWDSLAHTPTHQAHATIRISKRYLRGNARASALQTRTHRTTKMARPLRPLRIHSPKCSAGCAPRPAEPTLFPPNRSNDVTK